MTAHCEDKMRFLPPTDEAVLYDTAFDNDQLNRTKLSKLLSDFVDKIEDPLVIAINGKWGTGKSHFLKRWVGAHTKQNSGKALTVYFDAFAHDYISDPLIGLTLAVAERLPEKEASAASKVKSFAVSLAKPFAKTGMAMATSGLSLILSDIGDAAVGELSGQASEALDNFWKHEASRKRCFENFKTALESLTSDAEGKERPIVFVIDELDRCRPDYALEVLEVAKHFFSARNVHFVLGVNLIALEEMVALRYGARIDASQYLRKFISLELEMPIDVGDSERTPVSAKYAQITSERMGMPDAIRSELLEQISIISRRNVISLRDTNTIMSHLMIIPEEPFEKPILSGWRSLLVTLIIARVINPEFYRKLHTVSFTEKELSDFLDATPDRIQERDNAGSNYDHKTFILLGVWLYVLGNGTTPPKYGFPQLNGEFDNYYSNREPKKIPGTIYQKWLNVYRIN